MKRKMRRFAEGGLGYEENPQPGEQTDREGGSKKAAKAKKSRVMSNEEFTEAYKKSAPSERIQKEASKSVKKDSSSSRVALPSDRTTGYRSQVEATGMTPEERYDAMKRFATDAALVSLGAGAGRVVQGLKTAKRRYDIGKRVDSMSEAQQKSAFLKAAREAREVDGMKRGGTIKSSASRRADGIAQRGKTRGKFV